LGLIGETGSPTVIERAIPTTAQVNLGLPAGPWRVAWRPGSESVYAVLGREGPAASWEVVSVGGSGVVGQLAVPELPPGVGQVTLTALAWGQDGQSLAVAGMARTAIGSVWRYVTCTWGWSGSGGSPSAPTWRIHPSAGQDVVHDLLALAPDRLIMATRKGVLRLQGTTWTWPLSRGNVHGVILSRGQGALFAERATGGVRLVRWLSAPAAGPAIRVGPTVKPGKYSPGEVAVSADDRLGALVAEAGNHVYVYRLENLSTASSPLRTARTTDELARQPRFRPH